MEIDEYAVSLIGDSTNVNREEIVEIFSNTINQMQRINIDLHRTPETTTNRRIYGGWEITDVSEVINPYLMDANREITNMMAEQMGLDIDREILEGLSTSTPRCELEDFKDLKSYREEILVKKYGFR